LDAISEELTQAMVSRDEAVASATVAAHTGGSATGGSATGGSATGGSATGGARAASTSADAAAPQELEELQGGAGEDILFQAEEGGEGGEGEEGGQISNQEGEEAKEEAEKKQQQQEEEQQQQQAEAEARARVLSVSRIQAAQIWQKTQEQKQRRGRLQALVERYVQGLEEAMRKEGEWRTEKSRIEGEAARIRPAHHPPHPHASSDLSHTLRTLLSHTPLAPQTFRTPSALTSIRSGGRRKSCSSSGTRCDTERTSCRRKRRRRLLVASRRHSGMGRDGVGGVGGGAMRL
jgi:hypothetical protein